MTCLLSPQLFCVCLTGLCDLLTQQPSSRSDLSQRTCWSLRDENHESAGFAPFPASGVEDDTLVCLIEHTDGRFTAMIAMKKVW